MTNESPASASDDVGFELYDLRVEVVGPTDRPIYCGAACGFSSILDVVPNRHRGFAMAVSFFLNVALGAGLGPTSVALVSDRAFGSTAGLGPAIALTAGAGFFLIATVLVLTLATLKPRAAVSGRAG